MPHNKPSAPKRQLVNNTSHITPYSKLHKYVKQEKVMPNDLCKQVSQCSMLKHYMHQETTKAKHYATIVTKTLT